MYVYIYIYIYSYTYHDVLPKLVEPELEAVDVLLLDNLRLCSIETRHKEIQTTRSSLTLHIYPVVGWVPPGQPSYGDLTRVSPATISKRKP